MTQLEGAAALYGVRAADLEALGSFESDVYAFNGPHGPSIMKVISPSHRSQVQVQAEVDWLLALFDAGVRVAAPLESAAGNLVEMSPESDHILVAFLRAPGERVGPEGWSDGRIAAWGGLLGQLQAHSRNYRPSGPKRDELIRSGYLHRLDELVTDDVAFVNNTREMLERARPLLVDGPDAGLVHADLHHGNLLLFQEQWTAIDFDDSGYAAYSFDLAMPLYYAIRALADLSPDEAVARFLPPFMRGFRRFAEDPAGGADDMALFLQLRQAELVLAIRARAQEIELEPRLSEMERLLRTSVATGEALVEAATVRRFMN